MTEQASPPLGGAQRTSATRDPLLGRLLEGRYRIDRKVARGGMATVYEGMDQRLSRRVAIKVIHPGLGENAEYSSRVVREAQHAAQLTHPNVVGVFDQGNDDGVLFLVMEYIEGETLRSVLDRDRVLPPTEALAVAAECLKGLAAAHELGIMHRDMKPENVLVGTDGAIKVADFGLARAVDAVSSHTNPGSLVGTISYVAPELVTQEAQPDQRADVYAMGVILFELLTGQKPHSGDSPIQVAWKHVHEDVPAPSSLVPTLPKSIDELVARACARDPEARTQDASVMLQQVLAAGADNAAPESTSETTQTQTNPLPEQPADEQTTQLRAEPTAVHNLPAESDSSTNTSMPKLGKWPKWLAIGLALLLATAGSAWWVASGRYDKMPVLVGMTELEASEMLKKNGYQVAFDDAEFSEEVAKGEVLRSDPEAGTKILSGATITLVLSKGPERYGVPNLRGKKQAQAQAQLSQAKLELAGFEERFDSEVPVGVIIGTEPKAGAKVPAGAEITVLVSKGEPPIEVGSWVGEPVEKAVKELEARGLKVEVVEDISGEVKPGRIISQQPASGTLPRGGTVRLVVSRGAPLVQVPFGIVGIAASEARRILREAGFKVKVERSPDYLDLDVVYEANPTQGATVPSGSTVTLIII